MSLDRRTGGNALQQTLNALKEVIRSKQEPGKEHEPTSTEYFALITTAISVGSGGESLGDMLKILVAILPTTSTVVLRSQFKTLAGSILLILKNNPDDLLLHNVAVSVLGAILLEQEHSDGFWGLVPPLQTFNALLSYIDHDNPKIRKNSHDSIIALLRKHHQHKGKALRLYFADFCDGVILSCQPRSL